MLAVFFKVSCPVCQYTFPFLERMHKAYGDKKVAIVGISQDDQRDTAAFLKEYGVTFPTLLDDPNGYAVSNAYGLTNVPVVVPDRTGRRDRNQQRRMGKNRKWRTSTASSPTRSKLRCGLRFFNPEKTCATSALVEARKTDPAVAGEEPGWGMNGGLRGDELERTFRASQELLPRCFRAGTCVTLDPSR